MRAFPVGLRAALVACAAALPAVEAQPAVSHNPPKVSNAAYSTKVPTATRVAVSPYSPKVSTAASGSSPVVSFWVMALVGINYNLDGQSGLIKAIEDVAPGHTISSKTNTGLDQACLLNQGKGDLIPNCEPLIFSMGPDELNRQWINLELQEEGELTPERFYKAQCGRGDPFWKCLEPLEEQIAEELRDHAQKCHKPGTVCFFNHDKQAFEPRP